MTELLADIARIESMIRALRLAETIYNESRADDIAIYTTRLATANATLENAINDIDFGQFA